MPAQEPPRAPRVPLLDYRLVVLTNGRPCLRETLESIRAHVSPQPLEVLIFDDGGTATAHEQMTPWHGVEWNVLGSTHSLGFCGAVRECWRAASQAGPDFVLWHEDDFVYERDVDLVPLARILDENRKVAQMALMRGPANDTEIAAGGCYEAAAELYADRGGWLQTRRNFSTGLSLIRRAFMVENPWPDYDANCEGRFSIDLVKRGYTFGVAGAGEPWVRHIGRRAGWGY